MLSDADEIAEVKDHAMIVKKLKALPVEAIVRGYLIGSGWKQTALTLTYQLRAFEGTQVKFAAGNGEGENGENMDPQQYFGFNVNSEVVKGIWITEKFHLRKEKHCFVCY